MLAQLVSLGDGPSILLDKPILLVGRDPECDVQIDSRKISRRHCCIAQVNDYLVIRDLDSTNGVRINGAPVSEGRLNVNDELMIGGNRYRVSWDAPDSAPRRGQDTQKHLEPATTPAALNEDALLESCEEPIALPEGPGQGASPLAMPLGVTPSRARPPVRPNPRTPPDNLRPGNSGGPNIIPDEITLAPLSQSDLSVRPDRLPMER